MKKTCTKCDAELDLNSDNFRQRKSGKYEAACRSCERDQCKKWASKNKQSISDRGKRYREDNPEMLAEKNKAWYEKNREFKLAYNKARNEAFKLNASPSEKAELKQKLKLLRDDWNSRNPDKVKEIKRRWLDRNVVKRKQTLRRYFANNKDTIKKKIKAWRQTPRGRMISRVVSQRRRIRFNEARGTFTTEQLLAKFDAHGWCCYLCRVALDSKTVRIEHRIPLSRGGTNWIANIAPACESCNSSKGSMTEKEYREFLKLGY